MMDKIIDPASANGWHVDKRIPVAQILSFLLVILIQSAVFGFWLGSLSERLSSVEQVQEDRTPLVHRFLAMEKTVERDSAAIRRIEVKIDDMRQQMHDTELENERGRP